MCKLRKKQLLKSLKAGIINPSIPDLSLEGDGEYWDALFLVLSEFCECSLECVSRQMIVAGDEDHIARVSVCMYPCASLSGHS